MLFYILDSFGKFLYTNNTQEGSENWTVSPLPQPCWNPVFIGARHKDTGEWTGKWVHDGPPLPTIAELNGRIDTFADAARRAVAGDPLRAAEYERTAAEAQAFKDAGYPTDAVPRTVAAWAIGGRTVQESADGILAEAAKYAEALYQIRENRLIAKDRARKALESGDHAVAEKVINDAISAIQKAINGVQGVTAA